MLDTVEIRVCENPACRLRYPLVKGHKFGTRCPVCLGPTSIALTKDLITEPVQAKINQSMKLEALLDNIRSAWNVGAIFRTADGFGIQKLHLCGITPTPENPGVKKTAIGSENSVPWTHSRNAVETAIKLKKDGVHLWALEQDERAEPLTSVVKPYQKPVILVVGNEISGVDPALLDLCDRIIYIPMLGIKKSLNVEVAFGAAVAVIRYSDQK